MLEVEPLFEVTDQAQELRSNKLDRFQLKVEDRRNFLIEKYISSNEKNTEAHNNRNNNSFWRYRSYPVLSILAPAVVNHEESIEYPGDPICLYYALSNTISKVKASLREPFSDEDEYLTHCPQLARLPDIGYRLRQGASTKRVLDQTWDRLNTDQTVFDPRVWNSGAEQELTKILNALDPKVVLISSVSCAHRYALLIARKIREIAPDAITVIGGRHADETVQLNELTGLVSYSYSSTAQAICDGRVRSDVDFTISKDGAFCLDYLIKALSLAFNPESDRVERADVESALQFMAARYNDAKGMSILTWVTDAGPRPIIFRGPRYALSDIPNPYYPFANRAYFPIFHDQFGKVMRTAHVLNVDACPYACSFCSEGIGVMGRMNKLSRTPVETSIERLKELADFGAQAVFFDDSIMFGGSMSSIREFSVRLAEIKLTLSEEEDTETRPTGGLQTSAGAINLRSLQWGAQLTGEFLSRFQSDQQAEDTMAIMAAGGCTYVYFGIESLAESVMENIHKYRKLNSGLQWRDKIRLSLQAVKSAGIKVGSSVIFGLEGETRKTIDQTIDGVGELIDDGLIDIASPNIMTYHPGAEITRKHGMENFLDYHSPHNDARPPYSYFEQAYPKVVSINLTEDDIWYIHRRANFVWGNTRNKNNSTKYIESIYGNV